MITKTTAHLAFETRLQASYDRTAPNGGNQAILAHLNRVRAMTSAQFAEHEKAMKARDVVRTATAKRLARSLMQN